MAEYRILLDLSGAECECGAVNNPCRVDEGNEHYSVNICPACGKREVYVKAGDAWWRPDYVIEAITFYRDAMAAKRRGAAR